MTGCGVGAVFGISAGAYTIFALHQMFPDIFVLPIYAALVYALVGMSASLIYSLLILILSRLLRKSFSKQFVVASTSGWVAATFLVMIRLDPSATPSFLKFIQGFRAPGMVLLCVLVMTAATLLVFGLLRFFPGGKDPNRGIAPRALIPWLVGVYLLEIAFFSAVHHLKRSKADEVQAASLASGRSGAQANATRIVIIGVDGATWQVLDSLVAAGKVPNFARLIHSGVSGKLKTFKPTKSPVIWSSIATGKTFQKHGIMDFVFRKIPTLSTTFWNYYPLMFGATEFLDFCGLETIPVSNSLRQTKAFWNICNEYHVPVGVIGWWPSWPADQVSGFIVSERYMWDTVNETVTGDQGMTYPESLAKEIREQLLSGSEFDRLQDLFRFVHLDSSERQSVLRQRESIRIRPVENEHERPENTVPTALSHLGWIYLRDLNKMNLGMYLYQKYRPQVFAVYLKGVDPVQHAFWRWLRPQDYTDVQPDNLARFKDTIPNYYVYTDEILGKFLDLVDENTLVLVLSDHGFESADGEEFWVSGNHTSAPEGIIILSGQQIKKNAKIENASVLDITPTILYALGLPVGKDMDGKVLQQAFRATFVQDHPVKFIPTYETNHSKAREPLTSSPSDEKIKQQLRSLGYIK
ncbi:MAG: alkaline phosphatase family protein [bacterium]